VHVSLVELLAKEKQILVATAKKKYLFKLQHRCEDAYALIMLIWHKAKRDDTTNAGKPTLSYSLTEEEWSSLMRGAETKTITRGEPVIREGTSCKLYRVLTGRCHVERRTADGKQVSLHGSLVAGQLFGEAALLAQPAAYSVVTNPEDGATVAELDMPYVLALLERSPLSLSVSLLCELCASHYRFLGSLQTLAPPPLLDASSVVSSWRRNQRRQSRKNLNLVKR